MLFADVLGPGGAQRKGVVIWRLHPIKPCYGSAAMRYDQKNCNHSVLAKTAGDIGVEVAESLETMGYEFMYKAVEIESVRQKAKQG
jgi:hypothetical protein